jgi:hypothetical protein
MRQNTDLHQDKCFLEDRSLPTNEPALFFIMDFTKSVVTVNCSKNWRNMNVFNDFYNHPMSECGTIQFPRAFHS